MEVSTKPPLGAFIADEKEEEDSSVPDDTRFMLNNIIQHFDENGSEVFFYTDPFSDHCYFDICYCESCHAKAFDEDDEEDNSTKKKKKSLCKYKHNYLDDEDPEQLVQAIRSQYDPLEELLPNDSWKIQEDQQQKEA